MKAYSQAFVESMTVSASTPAVAKSGEVRALTGLRGIAAIYVVLFHSQAYFRFPGAVMPLIRNGYLAVDLFFILSGFVMAMTYAGLFADGFCIKKFKHFLLLRLARIYPLFALMTVVTAILIATVLAGTYDFAEELPRALLFNATLTHVWGLSNSIVPTSWSISTEWLAYLLFPAGIYVALRVSRRWALLGLAVSFATLAAIAYGPVWLAETAIRHRHGPLDIVSSYAVGTSLRCLASFYIGLVAYRFRDLIPSRAALPLVFLAILFLWQRGSDLGLIAVFGLLIMALSHDSGPVARALGGRVAYWLGAISYALYLVHDLIQKIIFKSLPAWGVDVAHHRLFWVVTSLAISIGLAALCHYSFEKPSRLWFRGLIKKPEARPEAVLSPAE